MIYKFFFGSLLIFLLSTFITWMVRIYAIHKAILDIPNDRSSHTIPTPRGGGIAIVLSFNLAIVFLYLTNHIPLTLANALVGGGITVAIIGYLDDVFTVKARWRILLHFLVAGWGLYWLGGFPILTFGTWKISLAGFGSIIALIGIVWCINFYNFMDGIDGLAGTEGMFLGIAGSIALWCIGESGLAFLLALLVLSIAGFTVWNWPPAKIFLGDVGSGFLGYVFAVLALYSINKQFLSLSFWLVIFAIFFWDATFTLIHRAYQGKPWYKAHREHAYQHLISYGASHKQVTIGVSLFNCCVLLPIAFIEFYHPTYSLYILSLLLPSLLIGWIWIKSLNPARDIKFK